jgi:mRNA interferase RelE/StbE
MTYRLEFTRSAQKEFLRLADALSERVIRKLRELQETPRPDGVKKLQGREGYRVRVGDYRMLYTIDDAARVIIVLSIAHRRDVYR